MKLQIKKGTTSKLIDIFIQDSSSTTGAGLSGLVYNAAGLTAYYYREGAASDTAITLATMTLGTWAIGGLAAIDGINMPGCYQLGIPDAALATGANSVVIMLKGAANMAPVILELQLIDYDPQDATALGLSRLDAAITSRLSSSATPANFSAMSITAGGLVDVTQAAADKVWSSATRTLTSLGSSLVAEIWNALTSGMTTVGSIGKLLADRIDAAISSRADGANYTAIRAAKLDNLDAVISSRHAAGAAVSSVTGAVGSVTADVGITQAGADKVWSSAARTLTAFSTGLAVAVWDVLESAIITANTVGLKIKTNLDAAISSRAASADYTGVRAAKLDNLDAAISSRLAAAGYTAPDNAGITAIKTKTDTIIWGDITDIKDGALGKWSINKTTNILTMYRADGVTILKQFNLTDNASVSERVPI